MAASSCRLRVQWTEQTLHAIKDLGDNVLWNGPREHTFSCEDDTILTIEDVALQLEAMIERLLYQQIQDEDTFQTQVNSVRSAKAAEEDEDLPYGDYVTQHLSPGDTIIVDAVAMSYKQGLKRLRSFMRFDLNDRVVCYCGSRWLSGQVVGTLVQDSGGVIPYLVKTDPLLGLPSRTISVPKDIDSLCMQEVCFDPMSQLHLVKAAALVTRTSRRPSLRFAIGEQVVCRICSNREDRLECWVPGIVCSIWPELPGERGWEIAGVFGEYPDAVPYKVNLEHGSWIYCHRDHHTLIRRKGMEPQTLVKGLSKRMELRIASDGCKEKVDHATERRKRLLESELSEDD